jgi:hypothetical protein
MSKQLYVGNKLIKAEPMNRLEYNNYRGWHLPEDGSDAGYLVEYVDGYISWSPAKQFEDSYRMIESLPFSVVLEAAIRGMKITRHGWNGKGMYIFYVEGKNNNRPYLAMKTVNDEIVPWVASQSDLLETDWTIII